MKAFVAVLLLAAVASAKPSGLGLVGPIGLNPAAHIASGSVSVGVNGAALAGPAGSVVTDNGLHSGRAGARLAGPSGTVAGWGAGGIVEGPTGINVGEPRIAIAAPVAVAAPIARVAVAAPVAAPLGLGLGVAGVGLNGLGVGLNGLGVGLNGLGVAGVGVNGLGLGLGVGRVGLGLGLAGHGW